MSDAISLFCQKVHLHFIHVLEDGLLGKDLITMIKDCKLKIPHRNICLLKRNVLRTLPVQKSGQTGPG